MVYEVFLSVYDVTNTPNDATKKLVMGINNVTRAVAWGGIFHGAIEIDGYEWSFGFCEHGSGVYACKAKTNPMYTYRETLSLGATLKTREEIREMILLLKGQWPGTSYNLLTRNCCHFCEELARGLGVRPVPGWVNRFAYQADVAVQAAAAARRLGDDIRATADTSVTWISNSWRQLVDKLAAAPPSAAAAGGGGGGRRGGGGNRSGSDSSAGAGDRDDSLYYYDDMRVSASEGSLSSDLDRAAAEAAAAAPTTSAPVQVSATRRTSDGGNGGRSGGGGQLARPPSAAAERMREVASSAKQFAGVAVSKLKERTTSARERVLSAIVNSRQQVLPQPAQADGSRAYQGLAAEIN